MADVCITEFTDPGCPWAYSAEPFRRRLSWLYGDRLEWRVRMVGLAHSPDEYLDRGFTPVRQARALATIAGDHGMPIDTSVRPRMAATLPACRAVVAARLHAPEHMRALEEALLSFAGCAVVISHDRWFLDRIATHVLAFEGESQVTWFEGNFEAYEEHRREQLGAEADRPHRITYKRLTRT